MLGERHAKRLLAVGGALASLSFVTACQANEAVDLHVKIECEEEMFLHVEIVDTNPFELGVEIDLDDAPYAVPYLDEEVGRFDLSKQEVELYLIRVTHPNRVAGPIPITLADLEPLYPGDDAPVSRFVVRENQCPTADDPPR